MTTEQTAQQLELAAQILRTGHPFMVSSKPNGLWCVPTPSEMDILKWPVDKYEIRPVLATPPDGRLLHNPDNLTPEQVGAGYRLFCEAENDGQHAHRAEMWYDEKWILANDASGCIATYRLPLSIPWPEEKPETPPFQLPPPPPGVQWHRTDGWQEGDLPQGWRPLVLDEESQPGDEHWASNVGPWKAVQIGGLIYNKVRVKCRTHRPLTFTHAGKTWTWHRPGDPMPCDGTNRVIPLVCYEGKYSTGGNMEGSHWDWNDEYLIGWRYADEKKTVPFDISDVPPCSVLSLNPPRWFDIYGVCKEGIYVLDDEPLVETLWKWDYLLEKVKINRSIPLTGKWNPDAWEPCHKEVDA